LDPDSIAVSPRLLLSTVRPARAYRMGALAGPAKAFMEAGHVFWKPITSKYAVHNHFSFLKVGMVTQSPTQTSRFSLSR
jgi:hypothetical protein